MQFLKEIEEEVKEEVNVSILNILIGQKSK